jgi:hypothetical protein
MPDLNDRNNLLGVIDFVNDAVIAEPNAPALAVPQFLTSRRSRVLLQCTHLHLSGAEVFCWQIGKFSFSSRQDEEAVAHFRERFISAMAWSNGIGVSPDASASSNARMSSSSSNSSRSFSYSSILITTATFSPFSLVRNWVGSFIFSPVKKVYSRQLEPAIRQCTRVLRRHTIPRRPWRSLLGRRGRLLVGCRPGLRASCAFCLLFAFRGVCVCG